MECLLRQKYNGILSFEVEVCISELKEAIKAAGSSLNSDIDEENETNVPNTTNTEAQNTITSSHSSHAEQQHSIGSSDINSNTVKDLRVPERLSQDLMIVEC